MPSVVVKVDSGNSLYDQQINKYMLVLILTVNTVSKTTHYSIAVNACFEDFQMVGLFFQQDHMPRFFTVSVYYIMQYLRIATN